MSHFDKHWGNKAGFRIYNTILQNIQYWLNYVSTYLMFQDRCHAWVQTCSHRPWKQLPSWQALGGCGWQRTPHFAVVVPMSERVQGCQILWCRWLRGRWRCAWDQQLGGDREGFSGLNLSWWSEATEPQECNTDKRLQRVLWIQNSPFLDIWYSCSQIKKNTNHYEHQV